MCLWDPCLPDDPMHVQVHGGVPPPLLHLQGVPRPGLQALHAPRTLRPRHHRPQPPPQPTKVFRGFTRDRASKCDQQPE